MTQLTRISALSPAKLNLFLHVTGQRSDGYHTLQTVFQLLDWGDDMVFELSDKAGVTLTTPMPSIATEDNLIVRAAQLLMDASPTPEYGASISITKRIPQGGGLGGGSSNAATTLLALNQLWALGHSPETLAEMGLRLGADVPVFVHGTSAWAEGIGEQLQAMELPARWYVILLPNCHVSTAKIFSSAQLTRDTSPITMSAFFAGAVCNDLQPVVEAHYPAVRKALNLLGDFAPAMMTGSGACVFAAVDDEASAQRIASKTQAQFTTIVARGVNYRPTALAV